MGQRLTLAELRALVETGENQHVEFKRKIAHPLKVAREAVAFANTHGGTLLIGVEDNRTLPGLPDPDGDEFLLDRALDTACKPALSYSRYRIELPDEAWILVYEIPEGLNKPYALVEDGEETVYYRVADRSIQASKELRQVMRQAKKGLTYRFEFGDKERLLMEILDRDGAVTLPHFAQVAQIPERQASRTLVLLVLTGLLNLVPSANGDYYTRKAEVVENESKLPIQKQ